MKLCILVEFWMKNSEMRSNFDIFTKDFGKCLFLDIFNPKERVGRRAGDIRGVA